MASFLLPAERLHIGNDIPSDKIPEGRPRLNLQKRGTSLSRDGSNSRPRRFGSKKPTAKSKNSIFGQAKPRVSSEKQSALEKRVAAKTQRLPRMNKREREMYESIEEEIAFFSKLRIETGLSEKEKATANAVVEEKTAELKAHVAGVRKAARKKLKAPVQAGRSRFERPSDRRRRLEEATGAGSTGAGSTGAAAKKVRDLIEKTPSGKLLASKIGALGGQEVKDAVKAWTEFQGLKSKSKISRWIKESEECRALGMEWGEETHPNGQVKLGSQYVTLTTMTTTTTVDHSAIVNLPLKALCLDRSDGVGGGGASGGGASGGGASGGGNGESGGGSGGESGGESGRESERKKTAAGKISKAAGILLYRQTIEKNDAFEDEKAAAVERYMRGETDVVE